jgi:hypothetical protein
MSQQQVPGQAQVAQALANAVAQGVNQLAQATPPATWATIARNGQLQAQAAARAQAQAQAAPRAQAQAPARTYEVTEDAEDHYADARGGNSQWGLPANRQQLIAFVKQRWNDFDDQGGGEWMLDLGELSTLRDAGDYSLRAWSIVLEMRPNNVVRIFHFGPTG